MRNSFADMFYELGKEDPKLVVVVADISPAGSIAKFRDEFPERFVNTGCAEQIMIGLCAGMALRGLRPFAYTIATFALYRSFEMVRDDIGYQELPITVVGIGGGVTYCNLGGTHHAMEDIGVACSIPNMTVIAPCDPHETEVVTRWCATQTRGPVYLRLGKAGEPKLSDDTSEALKFGKIRYLTKGEDIAIIGYGPVLGIGFEIAENLKKKGESVSIISCHTIKPLDKDGIKNMLQRHKKIIVIEETTPSGSIGVKIKAIAFDLNIENDIETFSLKDEFIHNYGDHAQLLSSHELDAESICEKLQLK